MGLFGLFKKNDINEGVEQYKNTNAAVLLDVRTREEYSEGHIEKSINLPLQEIKNAPKVIKKKDTPLFVYCHSGARSANAVNHLKNMGYTNVTNIGGIIHYQGNIVND